MGVVKAIKLTNIVSAYIQLPVGVHIIADKKYTVEEVENTDEWEGAPKTVLSIVLIEPAEAVV